MKLSRSFAAAAVFAMAVATFGPAMAQTAAISLARVNCQFHSDTLIFGGNPRFVLSYTNKTGEKVDISNGFKISSPDGAIWDSVTIDTLGYAATGSSAFVEYFEIAFALFHAGNAGVDTVGVMGAGLQTRPSNQLPNDFSDTVLAITVWNLTYFNIGKHICIDTSFVQPGGTWTWVGKSLNQYYPSFQGMPGLRYGDGQPGTRLGSGYCFYIYDFPCVASERSGRPLSQSEAAACASCFTCCEGRRGNVNLEGIVDLGDLSALLNYLTDSGYVLPCPDAANVDGFGPVDLNDLTFLVSFLITRNVVLPACGT